jgi:hypothetical protein
MSYVVLAARWMIAVPSGILFVLCVLGNWSVLLGLVLGRVKSSSLILPFLGPVFGLVFLLTLPTPDVSRFWWVSVVAEPTWLLAAGCLVTGAIMKMIRPSEAR